MVNAVLTTLEDTDKTLFTRLMGVWDATGAKTPNLQCEFASAFGAQAVDLYNAH